MSWHKHNPSVLLAPFWARSEPTYAVRLGQVSALARTLKMTTCNIYLTFWGLKSDVYLLRYYSWLHVQYKTIHEITSEWDPLFSNEILSSWKKEVLLHLSRRAGRVSVDSQQCVMVAKKNKVAVNSKSHHWQHREHESIVRFRDSLLLTFKLSQYFSFSLSYRAHFQMPQKHF